MQRTFIPWTPLFILALLWPMELVYAQTCGCADATNCPFPIAPDTSFQLCYDITDAFNNDLADPAQGVCGVRLTFTHQHIWDLEISLVSPAGDTVPLVGPVLPYFGTTNSVLWDVLFLPCSAAVTPDTVNGMPLAEVWTNNQDWPFAGIIGGSYHPVGNNCLESFASGPVNGSWCLIVNNQGSFYPGQILDFEILLCDNSGLLCCEADGGSLAPYPDVQACKGDSIVLDIPPVYYAQAPDTAEYGYQYLISDSAGLILELDTVADLSNYGAGVYNVCGLSYRLSESDSLYVINPGLPVDSLLSMFSGPDPPFCGDLSSSCLQVQISDPPLPTFLEESLCEGDSLQLGDSLFYEAGNYSLLLQASTGCDSLVFLNLSVFQADTTDLSYVLCPGDSLFVADTSLVGLGGHAVLLQNEHGCDSLLRIQLDYFALDTTYLVDTICQGEVYAIGDSLFTLSGNYSLSFSSQLTGCDSTVVLDLTVLDLQANIAPSDTLSCAVPLVVLDGSASSSGPVNYHWYTLGGQFEGSVDSTVVEVSQPGTYILEVSQGSCVVADTAVVVALFDIPEANAGLSDTLTCAITQLTLDGTASAMGQGLGYFWLSPNGNILSGESSLQPLVDAPGLYMLEVTDSLSGCVGVDSVYVGIDTLPPFVEAGPNALLNCLHDSVILDGSASYLPEGYMYQWTDSLGVALPWEDVLQLPVGEAGVYYLEVVDLETGCSAVDSAIVFENMAFPEVDAGEWDSLTCAESSVFLQGEVQSPGFVTYLWSTSSGHFVGAVDQQLAEVDAGGWYFLQVTDTVSQCSSIDSVFVGVDTLSPMVESGLSITLNCDITSWELGEVSGTSQGIDFIYSWSNGNGEVLGDELHLTIDTAGLYVLTVVDTSNGCWVMDTTEVFQNQVYPQADAGLPDSLTCEHPLAILDGSASTQNPFMSYAWYNSSGELIGMDVQVGVGQADTYCLVATNGLNFCADTACVIIAADLALPQAHAGADQAVDCETGQAILDATGSSIGAPYQLFWSGPSGAFLSDSTQLQVQVQGPAAFVLNVVDTSTSCVAYDSVQVYLDSLACMPVAFAGPDGLLNCYQPLYDTLDATATPLEPYWNVSWQALSGEIISGEDGLTPVVTAGTYVLEVSHSLWGLNAFDTVEVLTDFEKPIADAGPDLLLSCSDLDQPITLDGTASSQGAQYTYFWSTLEGNILSGQDGLTPLIDAFGIYDLVVTDISNGCSATDGVQVQLLGSMPVLCLPDILQTPCYDTAIFLVDSCLAGGAYIYSWSVSGGQILGPTDEAGITAYVPTGSAEFYLEVENTINACTATDTVEILAPSPCPPDCTASATELFTCETDSVLLSGLGSSVGPDILYSWQAISGSLCSASNELSACAASPGIYQLEVVDLSSGLNCLAVVEVQADTAVPVLDLPAEAFLDCSGQPVFLDGTVSDGFDSLSYQWSGGPGSCIVSGEQTPVAEVACVGTYFLSLTNNANGCVLSDTVLVVYDTLPPLVVLADPSPLTCQDSSSLLTGAGSDFGPNLSWHWYQDGQLLTWAEGISSWSASEPGIYCLEIVNEQNHCRDSVCVELLLQVDTPAVSFSGDLVLNCVDTVLSLIPDQTFDPSLQYQWYTQDGCFDSDPASYELLTSCAGTYFLEVFDPQTTCSSAAQLEVIDQSTSLVADAGSSDTLTCMEDVISLDGTASDTGSSLVYSWLSPNGNILSGADGLTPLVDAPGWYFLRIEDSLTACVAVDSVQIFLDTVPPLAYAGVDKALTCAVSSVQLEGQLFGLESLYDFTWYGAEGQAVASDSLMPWVAEGGYYVFVVQDLVNGCAAYDSVLVVWDTLPPQAVIEASAPFVSCAQAAVFLDGSASQAGGVPGFSWTSQDGHFVNGEDQAVAVVDSAGWYVLEVVDGLNACTDTAMVYVGSDFEVPQIVLAPTDTITCAQPEVILDGSASSLGPHISYQWSSLPPGLPLEGDTTAQAVVSQAGTYVFVVLNQLNGCDAEEEVLVVENREFPQAVAEALTAIDCMHPTAMVSGEEASSQGTGYSYLWYPLPGTTGEVVFGESQLTAEVDGVGAYVLEVTNQTNGCMARDTVDVEAVEELIASALVSVVDPTCPGFKDGRIEVDGILGGTEPYLYALDGAVLGPYPDFLQLSAGIYLLEVEDANGCRWDTVLQLVDPLGVGVILEGDTLVDLGDWVTIEAQLSGPVDTLWWEPLPPVDCDACTSFTYLPEHNQTYTLTVADSNGCIALDMLSIYVRRNSKVYLGNAFSPNGDGVNDLFYVQAGAGVEQIDLFQVYDRWGELLFEARHFAPNDPLYGWDGRLHGKEMNPGVYVWQVQLHLLDGRSVFLKGEVLLLR